MLKLISITICLLGAVLAVTASAENITVVGADGGPGEPGGSAEAIANAPNESNTARATGGEGGDAPGGSALATATVTDAEFANAFSVGGDGGFAPGGDSIAEANTTNSQGKGTSFAVADGGGSRLSGLGGLATATANMISTGGGSAEARADAVGVPSDATAYAESSGDGDSLTAIATAKGIAASSRATGVATGNRAVIVEAFSDRTTLAGHTEASGSNAGSSPVSVSVTAIGDNGASATGAGFRAEDGHAVTATHSGTSTGGGAVSLSTTLTGGKGGAGISGADGGDGGDVIITDANAGSGSTTGPLSIKVSAKSGFGGSVPFGVPATPGKSGKVSANLDVTHTGGDLDLDVDLTGRPESSQLMGRSTSGAGVTVDLAISSRDDALSLQDAVDAETTGAVTLRQAAIAEGTNREDGDDATSELSRIKSVSSLSLRATTGAGDSLIAIGGDGSAVAEATNTTGSVTTYARATGGKSFAAPNVGRGGGADAVSRATATGGGPATATAIANGGEAKLSGEANAVAIAISEGDGEVQAHATAVTSSTDKLAARTVATAFGQNAGSAPVNVSAEARANSKFFLATDSVLEVSARGESTGGADVVVSATGRGAELRNAVSGSTTGLLTLVQDLVNSPAAGTSLIATNEGGGDLSVSVTVDSALDAVFLGDIVAESTTGANVDLHVSASSEGGIFLLNPDFTQPDIRAESNGGDVSVSVFFENERADAIADSLVAVSTTGAISIEQAVTALVSNNASSFLSYAVDSESLDLVADAQGGKPGVSSRFGGDGGDAEARIDMRNESGTGTGLAIARGADGGRSQTSDPGDGGDALAEVVATTVADGQSLRIGDASESGLSGAIGGRGGEILTGGTHGSGGSAASSSTGTALGFSDVSVYDFARGGDAFTALNSAGVGGAGGDASSSATSTGTSAPVLAHSFARGGRAGGGQPSNAADGGNAMAVALASGQGAVKALARAEGGAALQGGQGGRASASATASGASGEAVAEAISHDFGIETLRTFSRSDVASSAVSLAESGYGLALPEFSQDIGASAFLTTAPLSADMELARQGNSGLEQAASVGDQRIVALGQWFGASESGPRTMHGELDLTLEAPDGAWLGAFDFVSVGAGFIELSVAIELAGTPFEEHTFDNPALAIAFFQDRLFNLGSLTTPAGGEAAASGEAAPSIRFIYDLTLGAGDAFGMSFGLVVPEPNSGLLLAAGLLLLARRGRDRRVAPVAAAMADRHQRV